MPSITFRPAWKTFFVKCPVSTQVQKWKPFWVSNATHNIWSAALEVSHKYGPERIVVAVPLVLVWETWINSRKRYCDEKEKKKVLKYFSNSDVQWLALARKSVKTDHHTTLSEIIWDYLRTSETIWDHLRPSETIRDPECDVSVSKLLGFETFPIFGMVSDSVSKRFGIEKSIGFGIGKNLVSKKYRIRYRKYLVLEV